MINRITHTCSVLLNLLNSLQKSDKMLGLTFYLFSPNSFKPRRVAQSVTCLTIDKCLAADQGIESSIPARYNNFVEKDHEIISTAIFLPSVDSRRVVVSYKGQSVHEVLVNCLVKLAHKKVWLGEVNVKT